MRKFLISSALIAAAFAANPASAQYHGGRGFENRLGNIAERIDRAYDRGAIDGRTARILQRDVERLDILERQYRRDGRLSHHERYWINQRFASINRRLHDAMGSGHRYARNDRWDRHDRDDRWDD